MSTKTMNRTYKLTDEEGDKMKNQLLQEMDNNDYLTAEYERVKLEHRGVIKQSDELISTLRRNIKTGTKEVEIEVTYNKPEAGKKTIKRTDTGEETIEEMHQAECDEFPPTIFSDYEVEDEDSPKNVYNLAQLPEANIEPEEETEAIDFEESEEPKPKYTIGTRVKFKNLSRFAQNEFLIGTITDLENDENGFYYTIKLDGLQYSNDSGVRCVYENELNLAEDDQQSNEAI